MKILSPAKINLFLRVLGRRPDGYHELQTLMCCISLYDALTIDFDRDDIAVHCDHAEVPNDETNLAHRAATSFFDRFRQKSGGDGHALRAGGVAVSIEKKIPVAAGLGGGSSNAAAVMTALNRHYGEPLTVDEMHALGRSIGADVPFFLYRKPALATGIGEKLKEYNGLEPLPILLVCPRLQVSTPWVYKKLNLGLTKCEKKLKNFLFDMTVFDAQRHLCNDLETVTMSAYPELAEIKERLLDLNALGALMSGSGPSMFGVFADKTRVQRAFDELGKDGRWRLHAAEMLI